MSRTPFFLLLAVLALLPACGPGSGPVPIEETRAVPAGGFPAGAPSTAERFGYRVHDPDEAPAPPPTYVWRLPEGWVEKPKTDARPGNFGVKDRPEVDCFLSVLPQGGGGPKANADRWRQQMGLPPYTAEEMAALPQVTVLGRPAALVDIAGSYAGMGGAPARDGYRLLGVIAMDRDQGVFLKFTGPAADAEAEKDRFLALAQSLRRASAKPPAESPHPAAAPMTWEAPAGWTPGRTRSMRVVTLHPQGREDAECYITVLSGRAGGTVANLNRWRDQLGQPALSEGDIAALPRVTVLGQTVAFLEVAGTYTDMGGGTSENYALLGVVVEAGDQTVTVKLTGPAEVVQAERESFVRFCESLKAGR